MDLHGVVLESKYAEYQFLIKGPLQKMWRDGYPVEEHQIIPLQFDRYLCEMDVMAANQEWGEGQRESVSRAIEQQMNDPSFRDMWVHVAPKPPLPWPTYDETHHNQIPVIAQATGMIEAALAYEQRGREGGPRPSVEQKLRELQEGHGADVADRGAPAPDAQPDEMFAV